MGIETTSEPQAQAQPVQRAVLECRATSLFEHLYSCCGTPGTWYPVKFYLFKVLSKVPRCPYRIRGLFLLGLSLHVSVTI